MSCRPAHRHSSPSRPLHDSPWNSCPTSRPAHVNQTFLTCLCFVGLQPQHTSHMSALDTASTQCTRERHHLIAPYTCSHAAPQPPRPSLCLWPSQRRVCARKQRKQISKHTTRPRVCSMGWRHTKSIHLLLKIILLVAEMRSSAHETNRVCARDRLVSGAFSCLTSIHSQPTHSLAHAVP